MNHSQFSTFRPMESSWFIQQLGLLATCLLVACINYSNAEELEQSITQSAMSILRDECLSCHNAKKAKGGLNMESRESLLLGSDSGIVLVPEKPNESYLLGTLPADSDSHMPPKKQLSDTQIASLNQWIAQGSPWDKEILEKTPEVKPEDWELLPLPADYVPVLAMAISEVSEALISSQGKDLIVTRIEDKKPKQTKLPPFIRTWFDL